MAKGSGGPAGDECQNLVVAATLSSGSAPNSNAPGRHREDDCNLVVAQPLRSNGYNNSDPVMEARMHVVVSDPITTREGRSPSHAGKNSRPRNVVVSKSLPTDSRVADSSGLAPTLQASKSPNRGGTAGPLVGVFKPSHYTRGQDGAPSDITPPLSADADRGDQEALLYIPDECGALSAGGAGGDKAHGGSWQGTTAQDADKGHLVVAGVRVGVRRLTPTEACRLQALPDDWFDGVPNASDTAKYAGLGDAVTASVSRWIGLRILAVEAAHAGEVE